VRRSVGDAEAGRARHSRSAPDGRWNSPGDYDRVINVRYRLPASRGNIVREGKLDQYDRGEPAAPGTPSHSPDAATYSVADPKRAPYRTGGLGVVSSVVVLARLLESWRVTPRTASHRISIFGQERSYPAANAGAIDVLEDAHALGGRGR
jgi:hypothetical protein